MRLFNEEGKEISLDQADLTKGFIREQTIVKAEAKPIDNKIKFAWADEDWEIVQVYIKNKPKNDEEFALNKISAQTVYTAMRTNTLI